MIYKVKLQTSRSRGIQNTVSVDGEQCGFPGFCRYSQRTKNWTSLQPHLPPPAQASSCKVSFVTTDWPPILRELSVMPSAHLDLLPKTRHSLLPPSGQTLWHSVNVPLKGDKFTVVPTSRPQRKSSFRSGPHNLILWILFLCNTSMIRFNSSLIDHFSQRIDS